MASRASRLAPLAGILLLLVAAGCERQPAPDGEQAATIPSDTVRLPAGELAKLPRYGVQRLACDTVRSHLESIGKAAATDTIEISLDGESLVIDPETVVMRRGDTITWTGEDLIWTAHFVRRSPLEGGRTIRGGHGSATPEQDAAPNGAVTSVVADGEENCGRYYFFVAGYDPAQPDDVYLADPPDWIY